MIFNSLFSEMYPEGYHLGFSLFFWISLIILQMFYGIYFLIQANKSRLVNKKEIYRGTGLFSIGGGFLFLFMQIGVFLPEDFFLYYFSGALVLGSLTLFYFYYWEKNLVNLKKIPTIIIFITFSIFLISLILFLMFRVSELAFISLIELFTLFLSLAASSFLIILDFLFTRRVKGRLRSKGILLIIGSIVFSLGQFMDHPPGMFIYPELFIILSPVFFLVSFSFIFYGTKGIAENMSSYYNQAHICLVHRGKISREEPISYCPECSTLYCRKCYDQVIKKDRCWNCGERGKETREIKPEEQLVDDEIILNDKINLKSLKGQKSYKNE